MILLARDNRPLSIHHPNKMQYTACDEINSCKSSTRDPSSPSGNRQTKHCPDPLLIPVLFYHSSCAVEGRGGGGGEGGRHMKYVTDRFPSQTRSGTESTGNVRLFHPPLHCWLRQLRREGGRTDGRKGTFLPLIIYHERGWLCAHPPDETATQSGIG